ncbi:MAG: hypothetical protein KDK90_26945 [Leptospiraceae bacterium]|nr:hypothetical protein [Leptospiraceae bacterium]
MINFSRIIVITSFIFIFCAIDSLTAQEKAKTSKVDDTPKKEAQEKEKPKQEVKNKPEKRLELILRRQSTTLYPYEQSRFHEFYPWYINRVNNKSKNLYFGFNYSFPKIDSYMDYSFMEIKKANLSMNKTYCNGGYYAYCRETPFSVGDYYRMESDLNFMRYIYSDKISLGGGLRHIQSNLSLVYPNSYNLYMGSKSIGPQISLKFKTSKLVGIYLSGKLNAFYLFGKLLLESSYVDDNYPLGYNYNYIT